MNKRFTLICGALLAGLAVALGAFGSHALKATLLSNGRTDTFETAVRYHMYHALALLLVGSLMKATKVTVHKKLAWAAVMFTGGVILFSGSLYVLCLNPLPGIVYLTPMGGVLFMIGWVLLTLEFVSIREQE